MQQNCCQFFVQIKKSKYRWIFGQDQKYCNENSVYQIIDFQQSDF